MQADLRPNRQSCSKATQLVSAQLTAQVPICPTACRLPPFPPARLERIHTADVNEDLVRRALRWGGYKQARAVRAQPSPAAYRWACRRVQGYTCLAM